MPNSPYLWVAAGMLWILDASINVSMEPFRALIGDALPDRQRCLGYSMQSWFIGVGAVVASALPWILANVFGVGNVAEPGQLPDSVKLAFYLGAIAFLGAVLWTVLDDEGVLARGTRQLRRSRGRRGAAGPGDCAHAGTASQVGSRLAGGGLRVCCSRRGTRLGQAALRARLSRWRRSARCRPSQPRGSSAD